MIAILKGGEADGLHIEIEEDVHEIYLPKFFEVSPIITSNNVSLSERCLPSLRYEKSSSNNENYSFFTYRGLI